MCDRCDRFDGYFSTKPDLYLATVASAADDLRSATRLDLTLPTPQRMRAAVDAHLDWIDDHDTAYRAVIQGGISSDPAVHTIVDRARTETIERVAEGLGWTPITPSQHVALRGWVGFLEAASLEWLTTRAITKAQLVEILTASVDGLVATVDTTPHATI